MEYTDMDLTEDQLFELLDRIKNDSQESKIEEEIENIKNNKKNTKPVEIDHKCIKCDSSEHIIDDNVNGILVCDKCGTVESTICNDDIESRQYQEDTKDSVNRCNYITNHFLPQSSLGTNIACSKKNMVKKIHGWGAMPYKERNLSEIFKEIQSKCRELKLVKCVEDGAKILYKNISECKHPDGKNKGKFIIIRGSNKVSLLAACIYESCKKNKTHMRSLKEISAVFSLKIKELKNGSKILKKLIKMKKIIYETKPTIGEDFIVRFCRKLQINDYYINIAKRVAKNIQKLNIVSVHTPSSVAIGSITLVIDNYELEITKLTIAKTFEISDVTITKICKKMEPFKIVLIDDNLTDKFVKIIENKRNSLKIPLDFKNRCNDMNNYHIDSEFELFNIDDDDLDAYFRRMRRKIEKYYKTY